MNSFGPMIEVPGLMRNKGCTGASLPSFAAKALKLFHSAIILDGTHGANRVTAADSMVIPVACGEPKKSPSYSTIRSSSNMPNPTRPSLQRKRAHRIGSFMLQNPLEQLPHLCPIPDDLDSASNLTRQFLPRRALAARNDGARVTHAFARRRRDARDESDHRLVHVSCLHACYLIYPC